MTGASPPAIEFRDVSFAYPDGTRAIRSVDLVVGRGERIALLGPNGAGKSTLMLHVNGILRATGGTVLVEGVPVTDRSVRDVRSRVGLVFQDPDDQLFMTTVYDDVAFGPQNMGLAREEVDRRVHEALHDIGLPDATSRPASHLSFGQRKRVALATVLAMDPSILVLDEPTSNLDPRARRAMLALLKDLSATRLVATHDVEIAWDLCDRAIVFEEGSVVADGPRDEVMGDAELLARHGLEPPPQCRADGSA